MQPPRGWVQFFFSALQDRAANPSEGREKNSHEEEEGILRARVCVCAGGPTCWGWCTARPLTSLFLGGGGVIFIAPVNRVSP